MGFASISSIYQIMKKIFFYFFSLTRKNKYRQSLMYICFIELNKHSYSTIFKNENSICFFNPSLFLNHFLQFSHGSFCIFLLSFIDSKTLLAVLTVKSQGHFNMFLHSFINSKTLLAVLTSKPLWDHFPWNYKWYYCNN